MMSPYVAVVGSSAGTPEEHATAEDLGRLIAVEGWVVVCGGLGGVMDAAARGCASADGVSVGVLPGEGRAAASAHLTVAISTGLGEARNAIVARSVDAVIAVGGEFGTLSEIALALKMGKPVVGLGTWEIAREGVARNPIIRVSTPAEAIAAVREALG